MKKIKILLILLCFLSISFCAGCTDKVLPSAQIFRDDARIGGSLSFIYDQQSRKIYVGGIDEVVQFSLADESKNLSEGNRIGFKIVAPNDVTNIDSATLEMNGVSYVADDFLEEINGQKQKFFNIYPLVSKEDTKVEFSIKWQDKTKKQSYLLIVQDGTKFLTKEGEIV